MRFRQTSSACSSKVAGIVPSCSSLLSPLMYSVRLLGATSTAYAQFTYGGYRSAGLCCVITMEGMVTPKGRGLPGLPSRRRPCV
jgi:hypothetical protein